MADPDHDVNAELVVFLYKNGAHAVHCIRSASSDALLILSSSVILPRPCGTFSLFVPPSEKCGCKACADYAISYNSNS